MLTKDQVSKLANTCRLFDGEQEDYVDRLTALANIAYAQGVEDSKPKSTSNSSTIDATPLSLDDRMKAAGMIPLPEMLSNIPLGKWLAHTGVTDLASFESWVKSGRTEFLRMQVNMELDKNTDDEMFEWVLAHAAVFTEVLCNFRAATGRDPAIIND